MNAAPRFGIRVPLWAAILTLYFAIVLPLVALAIGVNYFLDRRGAVSTAVTMVGQVDLIVAAEIRALFRPVATLAALAPQTPVLHDNPASLDHEGLRLLRGALDQMPNVASVFVGYGNGEFLRVANLGERYSAERLGAGGPEAAAYGV